MSSVSEPSLDQQVRKFRRHAALTGALTIGARLTVLWLLSWGTAVAALRAGLDVSRSVLLWGIAGLVPVIVAAGILGHRCRPPRRSVLSLLDLHADGGGLVMATDEIDLGGWRAALGGGRVPRLRGRYPWRPISAGVVFVTAAFLMPVAPMGLEAERPLEIDEEILDLAERIETLEQEGLLEEEDAEQLAVALESLEKDASGEDPAAAWEALDHLQDMTDREIAGVAESALAEGVQLAAAEAIAEALSSGPAGEMDSLASEAMAELAALTARAARDGKWLDSARAAELSAAAGKASKTGDPGDLLSALGQAKVEMGEKLDRLHAGGLIDLETLAASERGLEGGELEQLSSYLEDKGLGAASSYSRRGGLASSAGDGQQAGAGLSRGGGGVPMSWKEPSSADGSRWREQVLDPASAAALQQSHLQGLSVADPRALEPAAPVASGAVDPVATAGGGAAYTHTLLPRHRGVVKRYFDRAAGSPEPASGPTEDPNR